MLLERCEPIKVSIITVTYNSEKTISKTIESVLNQTYETIEYLIVDGMSHDRTLQIAEGYRQAFSDKKMIFRVISEKDNGIYDAMNKGIRHTEGSLVGIINSDDWYEPEAVETAVKIWRNTHYDLMYANIRMIRADGKSFIKRARKRNYVTSRDWNHPTQFVARPVYDRFQYRCENMSDDMDFFFRVLKAGYHIEVSDQVLANFRMGGVSNRIRAKDILPRIKRRYRIYRSNGFSRLYLIESVLFELIKYLLV